MASTLVHYGTEYCNRLLVLRAAGYSVDACSSVREFRASLEQRAALKAVLVAARPDTERRQVVTLTRENSHAGLVLFDSTCSDGEERGFDIVIPPQTRPEDWLRKIAELIAKSRSLNAAATTIREQSALLRRDAQITRLTMIEREKSATQRAKIQRVIDHISQKLNPSDR